MNFFEGEPRVNRVRVLLVVFIAVIVTVGVYASSPAGEERVHTQEVKSVATPESPSGNKAAVEKKKAEPGLAVIPPTGEKPATPQKEKETTPKAQDEKKATLTVTQGPTNTIGIDLVNKVPVRGVQFTMNGVAMTEVRTTPRTEGFLAKFSEKTGIEILRISYLLADMERISMVEFTGMEDSKPVFAAL